MPEPDVIQLEDQQNGDLVEFDLYDERDLGFVDPQTNIGQQLCQNLIEMTMDDDCLTDEETMLGAQKMLEYDLKEAVR